MIKRNIKVIAALAIVASIGTGVVTTHAASVSNGTANPTHQANINFKKGAIKLDFKNSLDSLVTAGTITQAQETAIQNLFTHHKDKNSQAAKEKLTNFFKTKLDTLVTAGTITQDQETAMINSLTSFNNNSQTQK